MDESAMGNRAVLDSLPLVWTLGIVQLFLAGALYQSGSDDLALALASSGTFAFGRACRLAQR